jgi:hypothetical protein
LKPFRPGLRIQILLTLTVLLVAAMTLTGFVVMRVTERDLLRYKSAEGVAAVRALQAAIEKASLEKDPTSVELMEEYLEEVAQWLVASGLSEHIVIVGKDGTPWVRESGPSPLVKVDDSQLLSVLRSKKQTTRVSREHGLLVITAPLFSGANCVAAAQVPVRIDRILKGLSRSQQLIWFYIALNALVLLVFGNFLLSRIVIGPIKRLVRTADHFEETDFFSMAAETESNEISHLTLALNRMVKRLAENKERMERQIHSLEEANERLAEAKEEILRSEKLSSIGRLAAGVAHEVGNPIGAILGYTNLLAVHIGNDEEPKEYLSRIEKEIIRIDTIVRELLDFSRPSLGTSQPEDINGVVSESVSFLSHQKLTRGVEIKTQLEQDGGMVWADPGQLKQVLINLMFNACDAMEEGGHLTIATRRTASPLKDDERPFIEIAVADTGKGIPASELDKIFHPFYTTKPPGKGTGLGLAICLRIVESFGGTIAVESAEGQGSTFAVRLPQERRA